METLSLDCTQPCIDITSGVFNVNSPTLNITNLSQSNIFILNGQNKNYIYELLTGETANIKSTYFKSGVVTFRYTADSETNQLCLNVNPYVNTSGEEVFEEVDCYYGLPATTITGQSKTNVDITSTNIFQDTTWVIDIEIDNYKTSTGYLIPVTSIDSNLGNNVVFDFYYNGTYGVDSPDASFTLTKERPSITSSVNNFIYMSGSGATSVVMVVSGATGAKWSTNVTTSYNSSTIQYTYVFDQSNPGKFDLFVKQNPFAGVQKKLGGISDNKSTYSSEFRTGPNTHVVIDSSLNGGNTNLYNSNTPLLTNNGFSKNYILSGVSINSITQFTDKFLIGGDFNLYNDEPVNNLVMVDKNGNLDVIFSTNQPFSGVVNTVLNSKDETIFVGGAFPVLECVDITITSVTYSADTPSGSLYTISFTPLDNPYTDFFAVEWSVDNFATSALGQEILPPYDEYTWNTGYTFTTYNLFSGSSPLVYFRIIKTCYSNIAGGGWSELVYSNVESVSFINSPCPGIVLFATYISLPVSYQIRKYNVTANTVTTLASFVTGNQGGKKVNDIAYTYDEDTGTGKVWVSLSVQQWDGNCVSCYGESLTENSAIHEYDILDSNFNLSATPTIKPVLSPNGDYHNIIGRSLAVYNEQYLVTTVGKFSGASNYIYYIVDEYFALIDITTTASTLTMESSVPAVGFYGFTYPQNTPYNSCEDIIKTNNGRLIYTNNYYQSGGYSRKLVEIDIVTGQILTQTNQSLGVKFTGLFVYNNNIYITDQNGSIFNFSGNINNPFVLVNTLILPTYGAASKPLCSNVSLSAYSDCYCYQFTNTGTTSQSATFIDCSGSTKNVKFKGTKRYCLRRLISVGVNVLLRINGNCTNNKCPLIELPYGNIVKLNKKGEYDSSFLNNSNGAFDGPVNVIKSYLGDTIVVGGNFTEYGGITARGIIILNQDGTIRSDFKGGFNLTGDTPNVRDIYVFDDGSLIVIGGDDDSNAWLTTFQNITIPTNIVKINSSGYIDTKFSATTGLDGSAYSIIMDCTGKLIVGGGFDCYEDTNGNHCGLESLLKIDSNGICDTTYSNDLNLNGEVKALSSFVSPNYEKLSGGGTSYCNCGRWVPVSMEGGFIPIYWKFTCDCATNRPCRCPETISCEEKTMFIGGNFTDPANGFVKIDNGSDIVLYDFITCDGITGFTYAPSNITNGTVILANVNQTSVVCGTVGNEVVSGDTNLYYSDGKITYTDCGKCYAEYQVKLLVREPGKQDVVFLKTMTKAQIDKVTQFGPIFATGGPESYEILDYWLGSAATTKGVVSFIEITPSPTLTPTKTKTPTVTKTSTVTRTATVTKTKTPTVTKTQTMTKTPNLSPNPTSTPTKTVTKTKTMTPTKTTTNTVTPTLTKTPYFVPTTPNPTTTPTVTKTATVTKTNTASPTKTKTPTVTPTKTRTPSVTPTKTKTPTPSSTPSIISFIDSFGFTGDVKSLVTDTVNNKYYSTTTGGTDVYNTLFIREQTITGITADTTAQFATSIFDTNNSKLYFGNPESSTILSYDVASSAQTSINISPKVAFRMAFDYDNNLLGILDGAVTPSITVIDTTTDSVNGVITGLTTGYKGDIAYDSSYAYVVGSVAKVCEVDLVNLVTASTFNISGGVINERKIIFNTNNSRFYVLTPGVSVSVVTSASELSTINISSYTGISQTMTFNPDKNYMYISNVSEAGVVGVITIDCSSNTVLNFTNNLRTGVGEDAAILYYDGITSELFVIDINSPDIYRYTT